MNLTNAELLSLDEGNPEVRREIVSRYNDACASGETLSLGEWKRREKYKMAGQGKKQCPGCKEIVGARLGVCECGHEFIPGAAAKKAEAEKKAAEREASPAGRGQKVCKGCGVVIGARSMVCSKCGYEYEEGAARLKAEKEAAKNDKPKSELGPGKKKCPQCQEVIGIRTRECPNCKHIFYESSARAEVPEEKKESAGKGKKFCPGCKEAIGVRCRKCEHCGYSFEDNAPTALPATSATSSSSSSSSTVETYEEEGVVPIPYSKGQVKITTPAGNCPVKLKAFDDDSIQAWCQEVVNHGSTCSRQYGAEALKYWVREFVDIQSQEYHRVCDVIVNLFLGA